MPKKALEVTAPVQIHVTTTARSRLLIPATAVYDDSGSVETIRVRMPWGETARLMVSDLTTMRGAPLNVYDMRSRYYDLKRKEEEKARKAKPK